MWWVLPLWSMVLGGAVGVPIIWLFLRACLVERVPSIVVDLDGVDFHESRPREDHYICVMRRTNGDSPFKNAPTPDRVICVDPSTLRCLGFQPVATADEVRERVARAREAQKEWCRSSFDQRRRLLKIMLRYIIDHQEVICRISATDSGKLMVDAGFGEVIATCEKIKWILNEGEKWLKPEYRSSSTMMPLKVARVEFHPLGVLGAIVPWNYPFHNILNPLLPAVFAGNAIVIKVSEHATWSARFYSRFIQAALEAAGAPRDLVQIVSGYAATGEALVKSGVDKLTFIGSTTVGKKVMEAAADVLTPLVLELGGKDAFIVLDDADLSQVVPIAMRAAFQASGQNCIGAERFYVQGGVYDEFVRQVSETAKKMRMGPPLEGCMDIGSLVLPQHALRMQELVDDAVAKGAKVVVGGMLPGEKLGDQFYPPTVLVDVTHKMRVMKEEVFGPLMPIVKVISDNDAVTLANDCDFALGCSVFSQSKKRANSVASRISTGMASINDFASTYMCQALPFGGLKWSGFDRFSGVEGLRGCCNIKAVAEDRFSFAQTRLPYPIKYPLTEDAFPFCDALVRVVYGIDLQTKIAGLLSLLKIFLFHSPVHANEDHLKTS